MRTLVLLDVDGTIVPTRYSWTTIRPRGLAEFELVVPPYPPVTVKVRPSVIEAVSGWVAAGVDVQWHTSWGWKAHWLARSIGLPELPLFYEPTAGEIYMRGRSGYPWKQFSLKEIADAFEEPVRIIWIDNEPASGQTDWLEEHLSAMHPRIAEVKLVRPDEERGLVGKDLAYAASLLGVRDERLARDSAAAQVEG